MFAAIITLCVVLLVTRVLVGIWVGTRSHRRRLHKDDELELTNAATHFTADIDSRSGRRAIGGTRRMRTRLADNIRAGSC